MGGGQGTFSTAEMSLSPSYPLRREGGKVWAKGVRSCWSARMQMDK